jgi:3-methyladenine DNA glycosylase/8-oxoguanine DNA glycosylase
VSALAGREPGVRAAGSPPVRPRAQRRPPGRRSGTPGLPPGSVEVRVEVTPRWVFSLPRRFGMDGLTRRRGEVIERLLHHGDVPVIVRVAQTAHDRVLFGAWAEDHDAAHWGIERMRRAVGVDHDVRAFHERFRFDPLLGRALRARPGLRVVGRPVAFEALVWAICEQLIEYERGAAIERRLSYRLGRRCPVTGLLDSPGPETLAAQAPALLASMDLAPARAVTLVAAAREVARARVDLDSDEPEAGWRRLRALRGIGPWTVQMLALTGQGRLDQLPAGDLGYLKLVGRALYGHPYARATEAEVEEYFAPYAPWCGLAGSYALLAGVGGSGGRLAA